MWDFLRTTRPKLWVSIILWSTYWLIGTLSSVVGFPVVSLIYPNYLSHVIGTFLPQMMKGIATDTKDVLAVTNVLLGVHILIAAIIGYLAACVIMLIIKDQLQPCSECGHLVSKKVKMCPYCGISNPVKTKLSLIEKIGIYIGLFIFIIYVWNEVISPTVKTYQETAKTDSKKSEEEPAAKYNFEGAKCRRDLQCWGEKNILSASAHCKMALEEMEKEIKRDKYRWTNGSPESLFKRQNWLDKEKGTLKYFGDAIEMVDAFGAYQVSNYVCGFDPSSNRVLFFDIQSGRLK